MIRAFRVSEFSPHCKLLAEAVKALDFIFSGVTTTFDISKHDEQPVRGSTSGMVESGAILNTTREARRQGLGRFRWRSLLG